MKKIYFILLAAIVSAACNQPQKTVFRSQGKVDYLLSSEDEAMLDSIQKKTFLFFMGEHHPEWGIVRDRTASWAPASIASTGFGIPSFAIGAERGWITRDEAAQITLNMMNFFVNSLQSPDTLASGYKGFYYHFLRMDTGLREWRCELSSVDTGLLMMGILFARNYYDRDNETENQIRSQGSLMLGNIEWDFMMMPDSGNYARQISMGWHPESGLHKMGWSGYNEALFLYILAAGNEYMRDKGIDYFENSRRATRVQRQYAIDNPHGWVGYDSLCWGVTASDGPGDKYNFGEREFLGYAGRGTSGPEYNYFDDGTIAPYGPLSSLPFAPEIVIPTIRSINEKMGDKIWGRYGYYDSFNLTAGWVNDDFIGIDQGPMLIMIENFRTGLVWNYVMNDPVIQKGLQTLGFSYL